MVGRLLQRGDFERLLATPPCSRGPHFVVHFLQARPIRPERPIRAVAGKLSTDDAPTSPQAVDESPNGHWLGTVIPKRHARRAVTRNMLRRQIRSAVQQRQAALSPGLWLVRLHRPLPGGFVSADSAALRRAAAAELHGLLCRLVA